jgi:hypothetical protein
MKGGRDMGLFSMRDSWNVWRRKVNEALGGSVEPIPSEDVVYDNTDSGLAATNVQSAIDEVADMANTKLQYITFSNPVNIFDLMDEAEGSRVYVNYATKFTNGETDLKTLLSVSQYARVELFNYSKYMAILRITDTTGVSFVAYAGADLSELKLIKIDVTGNSAVTITKA